MATILPRSKWLPTALSLLVDAIVVAVLLAVFDPAQPIRIITATVARRDLVDTKEGGRTRILIESASTGRVTASPVFNTPTRQGERVIVQEYRIKLFHRNRYDILGPAEKAKLDEGDR